ncbi:MAG TPA: PEP-CTERM sorting domain-containing protein [Acetobacteraceae bacterium]|nr:PEP-CTERM sorting domain-containing protein [Acetobacteraceae bacterium]
MAGRTNRTGATAISVSGDVFTGHEGNGVVQFTGRLRSITWTDSFENFRGCTVGVASGTTSTPEPGTLGLLTAGLARLLIVSRRRNRKEAAAD